MAKGEMATLDAFLRGRKPKDGRVYLEEFDADVTLRGMTEEERAGYEEASADDNGDTVFSEMRLHAIAGQMVEPDIRSTDFLKRAGVDTATEFLRGCVAGTITTLWGALVDLSGMTGGRPTVKRLADDAKN